MRTLALVLLILAPAGAVAYHYGPGQALLALDKADLRLQAAAEHLRHERFDRAAAEFSAALESIPSERVELIRAVRLERAKANLQGGQLPEAFDELTALRDESEAAGGASTSTVPPSAAYQSDLRKTLADAQYYMTWLQRLEGEPREAWEPDIEASRQNFRLLADASRKAGDEARATQHESDLEAAVRLARLDLSELQALPLPKQCQGCCSGNCKCKGKGKKISQNKGSQKPEDARGAGSGPPPDDKGS